MSSHFFQSLKLQRKKLQCVLTLCFVFVLFRLPFCTTPFFLVLVFLLGGRKCSWLVWHMKLLYTLRKDKTATCTYQAINPFVRFAPCAPKNKHNHLSTLHHASSMSWLGGLLGKDNTPLAVPVNVLYQRLDESQTRDDRKKTLLLLHEISENEVHHKVRCVNTHVLQPLLCTHVVFFLIAGSRSRHQLPCYRLENRQRWCRDNKYSTRCAVQHDDEVRTRNTRTFFYTARTLVLMHTH